MGDTKKIRKKYQTPMHPYNKERIEAERRYTRQYGLRNKKELWRAESLLKGFKDQIKSFPSMPEDAARRQAEKLRARLIKYGLVEQETPLGEVLGLDTEAVLDRRLQTVVFKKGMARSINQARQFINHEHITVNGRTVNAPSYLVTITDESRVEFHPSSQLASESHPERAVEEKHDKPKPRPKKDVPEAEQPEMVEPEEGVDDE